MINTKSPSQPLPKRADIEAAIENLECSDKEKNVLLGDKALSVAPRTREEVRWWVKEWLGFSVPDTKVCFDHDTPMDYLWALYCQEPEYSLGLCIAARASYKTLLTAIAEFLNLQFKKADQVHAGAIAEQANKCYEYLSKFLTSDIFRHTLKENLKCRTRMKSGNYIKVAPCTRKQMNSEHVPFVYIDELDLADEGGLSEAQGIPSSDQYGNKPSLWYISSWKYAHGPVAKILKNMTEPDVGGKVLKWCWKEATVRCPNERSGTIPTVVHVDINTFQWRRAADFRKINPEEQKKYHPFNVLDGCTKCSLIAQCRGDLKRANGNIPIDDWAMILKSDMTDNEFWISQIECRRPGRMGLVFPSFSEEANVTDLDWKHGRPTFASNDYGFNDPDVTLIAQVLDNKVLLITHESSVRQQDVNDTAAYFKKTFMPLEPRILFVDPSARHAVNAYKKQGIPARSAPCWEEEGERLVRRLICSPVDNRVCLLINRRCQGLIDQMQQLKAKKIGDMWTDGIAVNQLDDHYKALKYLVLGIFNKRQPRQVRGHLTRRWTRARAVG